MHIAQARIIHWSSKMIPVFYWYTSSTAYTKICNPSSSTGMYKSWCWCWCWFCCCCRCRCWCRCRYCCCRCPCRCCCLCRCLCRCQCRCFWCHGRCQCCCWCRCQCCVYGDVIVEVNVDVDVDKFLWWLSGFSTMTVSQWVIQSVHCSEGHL